MSDATTEAEARDMSRKEIVWQLYGIRQRTADGHYYTGRKQDVESERVLAAELETRPEPEPEPCEKCGGHDNCVYCRVSKGSQDETSQPASYV